MSSVRLIGLHNVTKKGLGKIHFTLMRARNNVSIYLNPTWDMHDSFKRFNC